MDTVKTKAVYVITPRGGRSYWTRVGVAFVNRDGSLNVKLEAMPVTGEIHIRDHVPREDAFGGTTLVDRPSNGNGHTSSSESEQFPDTFA